MTVCRRRHSGHENAYFSTKGMNLTARLHLVTSDQALNWRRKLPVACSQKGKPCHESVVVEPSFSSRVPLKQNCRRLQFASVS